MKKSIIHHPLSIICSRRGSAMLIAITFVGLITVISLGIGRLVAEEVRQNTMYRDSVAAYYAAEAGMNDAMYRISRNPFFSQQTESFGVNLATNQLLVNPNQLAGDQKGYTVKLETNPDGGMGAQSGWIGRDDPLEINLDSAWNNHRIEIRAIQIGRDNNNNGQIESGEILPANDLCVVWIAKAYAVTSLGVIIGTTGQFLDEASNLDNHYALLNNPLGGVWIQPLWTPGQRAKLRIVPRIVNRHCSALSAVAGSADNTPPGSNYKIKYTINVEGVSNAVVGKLRITSTGYAGRTKRAISRTLDLTRSGGQAVLDYTIYAGQETPGTESLHGDAVE